MLIIKEELLYMNWRLEEAGVTEYWMCEEQMEQDGAKLKRGDQAIWLVRPADASPRE